VKLEFSWSAETLEVRISDQGAGRVEELDLITELQAIDPQKTSGRGLAIMRGYADKFEVEEKVDGGLCFKLQWRLRAVAEIADRS
jgi:anti-sigma regulatory factor (Ser/Thr protein kinase)